MIRAAVAFSSYLGLTWLLLIMFCVWPKEALALVSPQAYARVVAQAEWIAYQAATKPAVVSAVAEAASAASPASIAIRAVAGPVGWAALGVMAGVALYQTYYSDAKMQAIAQAVAPHLGQALWAITSGSGSPVTVGPGLSNANMNHWATVQSGGSFFDNLCGYGYSYVVGPFPANAVPALNPASARQGPVVAQLDDGTPVNVYVCVVSGGVTPSTQTSSAVSPQDATNYLNSLPASNANSIASNSKPLGLGATPDTAAQVQTVPVAPGTSGAAQMQTSVKPASQVLPTDIVVAQNVPPPSGTQTTSPTTQQSQTTTTTVTNPDGSKTETKTTTAASSCAATAGHEQRTMGTVLAQHQALWNSSGLIGAVNLLKNLTWPTTLPVIDLPSSMFGTQHVDFNQWAWAFTALRTLVIAVASLAAYRIIFVGR